MIFMQSGDIADIQYGSSLPSESFLETRSQMHPKVCFHSDSKSSQLDSET